MQGLWKENLGGWNHKDTKRKRQSRKNTLRDKGRALLNVYDSYRHGSKKVNPNIFREEGVVDVEIINKNKPPVYQSIVKKYNISYPAVDENDREVIIVTEYKYILSDGTVKINKYKNVEKIHTSFIAYYDENDNKYKDQYTHEDVMAKLNLTKRQRRGFSIREEYSTSNIVKLDVSNYVSHNTRIINDVYMGRNGKEFLYNKPLYRYVRWSFYNDGKRRKIGQKFANRMTRVRVKQWIRNGDFEKEIKNHPYEKSIDWLID